ncbi:hypothetical protein Tsubulata_004843, partial [Turnera subulata]
MADLMESSSSLSSLEAEAVNFGKSIIVPSVQELAKESIAEIPPRYARLDQDKPNISTSPDNDSLLSVPVIDLHRLDVEEEWSCSVELERLHSACKDWGFFQVGSGELVQASIFREEEAMAAARQPRGVWATVCGIRGTKARLVGYVLHNHPSSQSQEQQSFYQNPTKAKILDLYCTEMRKLAMKMLDHMAQALKMDRQEMKELFSDGVQSVRMNYYPPCPEPDKAIGFTPHSDADALTILFQLNETEGLQIRKQGRWIPVKPLPNAFVVNIGDIMEIISNGTYRSIEHRATVNSATERLSVATFYSSKLDSVLGPAPSIIGPSTPAIFHRVPIEKYFKGFFARKLNGKSYLDFMKIVDGEDNKGAMGTEKISLGRSLLVPCVQELAKEPLPAIPPRYVRPDQDPPFISTTSSSLPQLPVIDKQRLLSRDDMDYSDELQKLDHACKEWGFFQLINHGVSSSLVEKVKVEIKDFFNMPMEEKKRYWQKPGEMEGFGQAFVVSEEQKLDWGDLYNMITLPLEARKPHLFPLLPLPLRDTLESYSAEMKALALDILDHMANALGMEGREMRDLFEEGLQQMRTNYYPPCPQPELVMGLSPHTDSIGLTILLQINEVEGLQIKKDGNWVPVIPLPNAFIINVGDILEIVTNGMYRSTVHRATVNTTNGEIGPAPSLVTRDTPAMFKRIGVADFFRGFFSRELVEKSYLDLMRALPSWNTHKTSSILIQQKPMGADRASLGRSLLVPCVQELAKEPLPAIPPRYVRPDQDPPFISTTSSSLPQLPVIDKQRLLSKEDMDYSDELQKMDRACKEWGFFQLINHGVSSSLVEKVKMEIKEKEEILAKTRRDGGIWTSLCCLRGAEARLGRHFLHDHPPLDTLESYSAEMKNLALEILDLMAKALGMEASEMRDMFEEGCQKMRMNYYPPCPQPELVMGLNPHTDAIGLTILLQISEVEGLQIKIDGNWVPVKPLPNAFIINVGDILEIVSNGRYRSTVHRATVNSTSERLSIATFYSPNLDGELGPAPSLVTKENPALFRRISVADYFRGFFARELVEKSYLDEMRIQSEEDN